MERRVEIGAADVAAPVPQVPAGADITFPSIARLELDELLTQLMQRAQDVLNTQSRLRGLLTATRTIAADLDLPVLLRRITQTACELVGARYGALGVIGSGDELAEFITVGVGPEVIEDVGRFPHGKGILGLLIADPQPLRLEELGKHPKSVGFPAGHPPMHTFLGVPIRIRDQVFGNLYLTEKTGGGMFTAEDEELLSALASAAAVAIDNARLFDNAQRKQRWLEASAEIARRLLAGEDAPLPLIASRARDLAAADLATVVVPIPQAPDSLLVVAAEGVGAEQLRGVVLPRSQTLSGRALDEGADLAVRDAREAGSTTPLPGVPVGPALVVRLAATGEGQPGVLTLSRTPGATVFNDEEREMASGFADQASLALELAGAQATQQRLLLVEDRDRIARDLHDEVIQRLFATGLGLSGEAARTRDPDTAARLGRVTDDLDDTIQAIRRAIFELRPRRDESGARARVLAVVGEVEPSLGFGPEVRLDGPLDALVPAHIADQLVAVLREALTNVAKHASASRVQVAVRVDDGVLCLVVDDDGVGLGPSSRRSGLANLRSRAEQLGGTFAVDSPGPGGRGTHLEWTAPLTVA